MDEFGHPLDIRGQDAVPDQGGDACPAQGLVGGPRALPQLVDVAFSPQVSDALQRLKAFNLEHIYLNPSIKQHTMRIKELFELLFEKYLTDIHDQNKSSVIFRQFLKDMTPDYLQQHRPAEIVRDFISGMTDQYFLDQCPESMRPVIRAG